jgi:hypothetical protein
MITDISKLDAKKLLDTIILMQKAVGVTISHENISFSQRNDNIVYYKINGKSQGRVYVHHKNDEEYEVQMSADDPNGNFIIFKNINKTLHWYLDTDLTLKSQFVVLRECKNESTPYEFCLQIVAYLDIFNCLEHITYMYFGYNKEDEIIIEKTKETLLSLDDEDIIGRYRYQQFKHLENFNQMFDDIHGPIQNPLTMEEIKNRITLLEAIIY